jgi:transposase
MPGAAIYVGMSDTETSPPPPSRACNECGEQMKHLTDLRRFQLHSGKRIFRCYTCNNVVSELL